MFRELIVTLLISFISAAIAIAVFYFSFMHKTEADPVDVFSTLYGRCTDYVERSEVFDTTDLVEGGLLSSATKKANRIKGMSLWHHPKALMVVKTIDTVSSGVRRRQCKIHLSEFGDRPPLSTIGQVLFEFFSIKRWLLSEGDHLEYVYKYPVPETFSFRSKEVDEQGCFVIHSFLLDTLGENYHVHIFQEGIACQKKNKS